jgi:hypothetical protein
MQDNPLSALGVQKLLKAVHEGELADKGCWVEDGVPHLGVIAGRLLQVQFFLYFP